MKAAYTKTEVIVGWFVIAGTLALVFLATSLGGLDVLPARKYEVEARFASVGDLKKGAQVKLAGVKIGEVQKIELENFIARVRLEISEKTELPSDTIASIRTEGLLGESYVALTPGASEENLSDEGRIEETEPAIDLIDLLSRYAFGSIEPRSSR